LVEAARVLKKSGELLIAEVESRCKSWERWVEMVESLGFGCRKNETNGYFRLMYFGVERGKKGKLVVEGQRRDVRQYSQEIMGGCLYKKR
jgi:ubiquinone/menaquinone biosynthesis C-methylase UbiE